MASFPIHDDLERTIEAAVEAGVSGTAVIAGRILKHHSNPPAPDVLAEHVETHKQGRTESAAGEQVVQEGSITDQELREALKNAGVSGENAGEMPS